MLIMIFSIVFLHSFRIYGQKRIQNKTISEILDLEFSFDFMNLFFLMLIFLLGSVYEFCKYFELNNTLPKISEITYIKTVLAYIAMNMLFPVLFFRKKNNYINTLVANIFFVVYFFLMYTRENNQNVSFLLYETNNVILELVFLSFTIYIITSLLIVIFSFKIVPFIIFGLILPSYLFYLNNFEIHVSFIVMIFCALLALILSKQKFLKKLIFLIIYPACLITFVSEYYLIPINITVINSNTLYASLFLIIFHFCLLNFGCLKKFNIYFFLLVTFPLVIFQLLKYNKFDFMVSLNLIKLISITVVYLFVMLMLYFMKNHWILPGIIYLLTPCILIYISIYIMGEPFDYNSIITAFFIYIISFIFYIFMQYKKQIQIIKAWLFSYSNLDMKFKRNKFKREFKIIDSKLLVVEQINEATRNFVYTLNQISL
jgi:hypothetical protein